MSQRKRASSQASWSILAEGVSASRVEAHILRTHLNQMIEALKDSPYEDEIYRLCGDNFQALPKHLAKQERHLDRTNYALISMGGDFYRQRLTHEDRELVDLASKYNPTPSPSTNRSSDMRRTASEVIRSLEARVARLESKTATFNPSKLKKGDLVLYFAEGKLIRGEFQRMTGGGAEVVDVKAPRGVRMGRRIVDLHFLREDQQLLMDKSARVEAKTAGVPPKAMEALVWLKSKEPLNPLERYTLLMGALEDANYHSELANLQRISGIQYDHTSKMADLGVELSKKLEWDGDLICLVVLTSAPKSDQRGLLSLLRSAGLNVKTASKRASVRVASSKLFAMEEALQDISGVEELEVDVSEGALTFIMDKFTNRKVVQEVKKAVQRLKGKFELGEMTGLGIVTASKRNRR